MHPAGWVQRVILRNPGHFASIVDLVGRRRCCLRSVGSGVITPYCQRKGRQVVPVEGSPRALKPQKSSPFGSKVEVSAAPTAWPLSLTPNAIAVLVHSESGCADVRSQSLVPEDGVLYAASERPPRQLTKPLLVMGYAWPSTVADGAEVGDGIAWWSVLLQARRASCSRQSKSGSISYVPPFR